MMLFTNFRQFFFIFSWSSCSVKWSNRIWIVILPTETAANSSKDVRRIGWSRLFDAESIIFRILYDVYFFVFRSYVEILEIWIEFLYSQMKENVCGQNRNTTQSITATIKHKKIIRNRNSASNVARTLKNICPSQPNSGFTFWRAYMNVVGRVKITNCSSSWIRADDHFSYIITWLISLFSLGHFPRILSIR